MSFFWCVFFSLIVTILNLSQGYNERIFFDEQKRIIKENIYVDYLTTNATVLAGFCLSTECKSMNSLSTELSDVLTDTLSNDGYDNSITADFCIYNNQIIVYTTNYFNISRYTDSSLSYLSELETDVKSFCNISDESGIALVKDIQK